LRNEVAKREKKEKEGMREKMLNKLEWKSEEECDYKNNF